MFPLNISNHNNNQKYKVYVPIWKEAQKDHRFAVLDQRLKEIEIKHKEHEARIIAMEPTPAAP
jgi:hypothetical protein